MHAIFQELGSAGDGYYGKTSPHTVNEIFAGLSLDHMAQVYLFIFTWQTQQALLGGRAFSATCKLVVKLLWWQISVTCALIIAVKFLGVKLFKVINIETKVTFRHR